MKENKALIHWLQYGFLIIDSSEINIDDLVSLFEEEYRSRFTENTFLNRNLLKCFTNEPLIKRLFLEKTIFDELSRIQIKHPVFTGPIVSHYTSSDITGGGFGLQLHQDWPSMATSSNGAICWISLYDTNPKTHGITVIPGSHLNGSLPGKQTDFGYLVEDNFPFKLNLEIKKGCYLLMHPWLVHATFVNPSCKESDFKLSLSTRFDDFECPEWANKSFRNAYSTKVDRKLWQT